MSTPLRVSDRLIQEAQSEGSIMHRSVPKQLEYWAELGKRVAHSVSATDLVALMQGIAELRVEIPTSKPLNPDSVFAAVDSMATTGELAQQLTQGRMYYEASKHRPGYLDQVMPDGNRSTGRWWRLLQKLIP